MAEKTQIYEKEIQSLREQQIERGCRYDQERFEITANCSRELNQATLERDEARNAAATAIEAKQEAEAEKCAAAVQILAHKERIEDLDAVVKQLESKIESERLLRTKAEDSAKESGSARGAAQQQLGERSKEIEDLNKRLKDKTDRNISLMTESRAMEGKHEKLQGKHERLVGRFEKLESKYKKLEGDRAETNAKYSAKMHELLNKGKAKHEKELDEKQQEYKEKLQRLKEYLDEQTEKILKLEERLAKHSD